jgi:predicted RNA-binding Zn ribbon-like protein
VRKFAALHFGAEKMAEHAAEKLVAGVAEEAARIGEHADEGCSTWRAFARFDHDHSVAVQSPEVTVMRDVFDFTSRFGVIGRFADEIALTQDMTSLLRGAPENS